MPVFYFLLLFVSDIIVYLGRETWIVKNIQSFFQEQQTFAQPTSQPKMVSTWFLYRGILGSGFKTFAHSTSSIPVVHLVHMQTSNAPLFEKAYLRRCHWTKNNKNNHVYISNWQNLEVFFSYLYWLSINWWNRQLGKSNVLIVSLELGDLLSEIQIEDPDTSTYAQNVQRR